MRRLRALTMVIAALAVVLAGCGKTDKKTARFAPRIAEAVPLGPLTHVAVPTRYRLSFVVDPDKKGFVGHDEIDVTFSAARRTLFLHGMDLDVRGVVVRLPDGKTIPAHYDQVDRSGVARLIFVDPVPAGPATLIFDYEAPYGQSLEGLYKVVNRGVAYAFTQFEAVSARRAFPSFDEPGFKTPFEVTVTAPQGDSVIANTPEKSVSMVRGGMKRIAFAATKPLPTYLIALAVGPLDIVDGGDIAPDGVRAQPIHLRGITAKGDGARIRTALAMTPKLVTALETYFGVAYPFPKLDILAVPDFAAGAMENAGAITFRERLLLFDAKAPLEQKRASMSVQAHELTHQWFGDLVTPKWWDDIWLNESFATWMASKAAAAVQPEQQYDTETLRSGFDAMKIDELNSARQIRQPVHTENDISEAFDGITYSKGAAVLTMFENYVGENAWRAGIHAYLTKYSGRNATAKDFVETINGFVPRVFCNDCTHTPAEPDFVAAFDSFLNQPGVPTVRVATQCGGAARMDVAQSFYSSIGHHTPARLWGIPICVGVAGGAKNCELINASRGSVPLGKLCPTTLMPNKEGNGYYRFTLNDKDWRALIAAAPKLSPADQITLLQNADAALRSGNTNAADLLSLIRILAPQARWDVLDTMAGILHRLRETGMAGDDLTPYRAFVRKHFGPRFKAVGISMKSNEKPEVTLAREKLATLLVAEGADPLVISKLSSAAHLYVASNGQKAANLAPDVLGDALRAGLLSDPAFAVALAHSFEVSNDEAFRRLAIYAFSGSSDPAAISQLLSLVPKMRTGELRYLFQYMSAEPVARGVMWNWFRANYDMMLKRASSRGLWRAVTTLSNACDAGARISLANFFGPKTGMLQGSARPLALAEERIDQCIAAKTAKGGEIAAALKAQP